MRPDDDIGARVGIILIVADEHLAIHTDGEDDLARGAVGNGDKAVKPESELVDEPTLQHLKQHPQDGARLSNLRKSGLNHEREDFIDTRSWQPSLTVCPHNPALAVRIPGTACLI